ncbi:MAG: hypothetical protein UFA98_04630 [Ruminococcus sp.]|nr:hypothetical protein [Ruminococcus sp.]
MKQPTHKPDKIEDVFIIESCNPNKVIGTSKIAILNLTVLIKDGVPAVSYLELWDEGGHFGSGESELAFPDAVYQSLSPDSIVDWLQEHFSAADCASLDWESIRQNPKLKAWCEKYKP